VAVFLRRVLFTLSTTESQPVLLWRIVVLLAKFPQLSMLLGQPSGKLKTMFGTLGLGMRLWISSVACLAHDA
jgi:hypothetical protein